MRTRTLLFIFILIIVVTIVFALCIGSLVAFIKEKYGNQTLGSIIFILFIASVIYIILTGIKSRKELEGKKVNYLVIGKLLFKNYAHDFEIFYNSYLQAINHRDLKKREPIEVLQEFAQQKDLSRIIDWRGEEDTAETEKFISRLIGEEISWTNTLKLRRRSSEINQRDGKFIISLFKTIQMDLNEINKKLLFFDLKTDSYIYTVADVITFRKIVKIGSGDFHGSEKLKD